MKRQSIKTQMVVSGIFFLALISALMVFLGQTENFNNLAIMEFNKEKVKQVPPLEGHWLKTGEESYYQGSPAKNDESAARTWVPVQAAVPTIFTLEEAKTALNRSTNGINIMYIWSDGDHLKVISVTSFNKETKQAAIVVVPLYTVIDNTSTVNLDKPYTTIQDLYKSRGRDGVKDFLEQKLEISIPNFVQVNQSALQKLSEIIGVLKVNNDETTMLEAFEQTAAGIRTDDREVVRAVASQVLRPGIILEIPKLLYIFTHDIQTNFSTQEMIYVFNVSRKMDLQQMRKTSLPGYEHMVTEEKKFLFVPDQAWKNVIYDITRSFPL